MTRKRISIGRLRADVEEGADDLVAGRLVALSPATLTLEDVSDRRSFGFTSQSIDRSRLRVGDILEVQLVYKDRAWRVSELRVLTPCLLEGSVYRAWLKRWLAQGDRKRRCLNLRERLFAAVRRHFKGQDFLEMQTPTLVPCGGMEPNLQAFATSWKGPDAGFVQEFHLPTSPEFQLKKLLALGYEKIFELARSYRNGEISPTHQPEFTMLEWYRAYDSYETIMNDVEELVSGLAVREFGEARLVYKDVPIDLTPPWHRVSVRELFLERLGLDLDTLTDAKSLARAAKLAGYGYVREEESFDDCYFRLFLTEIEQGLGWDKPVILYDYPIEMAALARRKPQAPRYAERFEVYMAGIELANAFGELTNAPEQARRFDVFTLESEAARGFHYEPDREFLEALQFGLPPTGGIALGLDRLIMLFANETAIDAVLALPHKAPVKSEEDALWEEHEQKASDPALPLIAASDAGSSGKPQGAAMPLIELTAEAVHDDADIPEAAFDDEAIASALAQGKGPEPLPSLAELLGELPEDTEHAL